MSKKTYDVLIAGAGPVGLLLASELALARGISVLVLERDQDPTNTDTLWKSAPLGIRGINTNSAEAFYRRGLLEDVIGPEMFAKRPMDLKPGGMSGHFAGMMLDTSKVNRSAPCWKYKLPGPSLCPSITSLKLLTDTLYKRAQELGVEVRGGVDVADLTQDDAQGEVVVHTQDKQEYRGKWLVGCDGGRSKIRKAAGFEFVGTEPEISGWTALCDIDDPNNRIKRGFTRTAAGIYATLLPGSLITMEPVSDATIDKKEITREEFEVVVRRVTGFDDISVTSLKIASSYTDRSKQAATYRKGRIFLAGDSAHIHSPLGGQGLNAGIGDAMNLGWKLASVINGFSTGDLLDTYEKERHPVGAWITEWTRAQVTTLKPSLHGQAIANLVKDLIATNDGVTYMTDKFWGLSQRYDLSTDDKKQQHPLVGSSVPDFDFADGSGRLGELQRSGHGLIIDFRESAEDDLKRLAQKWHSKIDFVQNRAKDELGLRALVVRPDGIVAWATDNEVDLHGVEAALSRWYGVEDKPLA